MPYTKKAHNFFEAVAHGMKPKGSKLTQAQAAKMASEGIKPSVGKKKSGGK